MRACKAQRCHGENSKGAPFEGVGRGRGGGVVDAGSVKVVSSSSRFRTRSMSCALAQKCIFKSFERPLES
eukprot:9230189-Pyramimonas_sp.AAC.1